MIYRASSWAWTARALGANFDQKISHCTKIPIRCSELSTGH